MKGIKISFLVNGMVFSKSASTDMCYILEEELLVILDNLNKCGDEEKVKIYNDLSKLPPCVILSMDESTGKYDLASTNDLTIKLSPYLESLVEGGFGFDLLL